MGARWETGQERSGREWVAWAAGGIVLLLIVGGIVIGVVVSKGKGDSTAPNNGSTASSTTTAPAATVDGSQAPAAAAAAPVSRKVAAGETTATEPAASATGGTPGTTVAESSIQPTQQATPAVLPASPLPAPAQQSPVPAAPKVDRPEGWLASGTLNGAPPVEGNFEPAVVPPEFKGTCELQQSYNWYCNDDMDYGATDSFTKDDFQLMQDAVMMEKCGIAPMTQIVNSLVKWAYKGKCGIDAFTVARGCVGRQETAAGYWRARVFLWPDDWTACTPLCIKMRGIGETVTAYGRTVKCN